MKYRQLPRTDLSLSEVGFGVWTVATNWWGNIPEEQRSALLENAVELGVNFFDTADTYGEGYGEEILAKFIGYRRHEIVIATKFGYDSTTRYPPASDTRSGPRSSSRSSSASPASRASAASTPTTSTSTSFTTPGSAPLSWMRF